MAQIVFDENYGEVSRAQRAAYRKFNVSPSDHDELLMAFGDGEHARITAYVKRCSGKGYYQKDDDLWTPYQY